MAMDEQGLNLKLMKAAKQGDCAKVEELLAQGADPLDMSIDGCMAVELAASAGHAECVRALAPVSGLVRLEVRREAMRMAMRKDSSECLMELWGEEGSEEAEARGGEVRGKTMLAMACSMGAAKCARLLLPYNDPLDVCGDGKTALMEAAINGTVACVELLLPVSDCLAKDNFSNAKMSAEGWAKLHGNVEVAAMISSWVKSQEEAAELRGVSRSVEGSEGRRSMRV